MTLILPVTFRRQNNFYQRHSLLICLLLLFFLTPGAVLAIDIGCTASARYANTACAFSVLDDLHAERAICMDGGDDDLDACLADLEEFVDEEQEECDDINEARLELCEMLNDAPHAGFMKAPSKKMAKSSRRE